MNNEQSRRRAVFRCSDSRTISESIPYTSFLIIVCKMVGRIFHCPTLWKPEIFFRRYRHWRSVSRPPRRPFGRVFSLVPRRAQSPWPNRPICTFRPRETFVRRRIGLCTTAGKPGNERRVIRPLSPRGVCTTGHDNRIFTITFVSAAASENMTLRHGN